MPEGPEVTITSQYLLHKLKNKLISNMEILSGRYIKNKMTNKKLFDDNEFIVINIDTKGKLMWIVLKNTETSEILYMTSHFGLTGQWSFYLSNSTRITFDIYDKKNDEIYKLYYSDDINIGTIEIISDKKLLDEKLDKLSPDFLKTSYDCKTFNKWFDNFKNKTSARSKMLIGKVLMNQDIKNGIGSGIGNYLNCEILYRAKINPHKTIGSFSKDDINNLCYWIKYTIKLAYYNNSIDYIEKISKTFIDSHMIGILSGKYPNYHSDIKLKETAKFKFLIYKKKEDTYGNKITADKTVNSGRTMYWVKEIQHK